MRYIIADVLFKLCFIFISFLFYFMIQFVSYECSIDWLMKERIYDGIPFFILLVLLLLYVTHSIYKWKKEGLFKLVISLIPALVTCILMFQTNLKFLDEGNYYENFNSQFWKSQSFKSIKMLRTIVKDDLLRHKTMEEVIKLLGNKSEYNSSDLLQYDLLNGRYVQIIFIGNRVEEIKLSCLD
ncbi:MAG: hypothetical protein ACPGSD_08495 [Flavobacteriales bacterium]